MVERYQQQVRSRPAAQQDLNVRPTAEAFGAGVARGLQSVGQGLDALADVQRLREAVSAEDTARAHLNQYREAVRQVRYDPETGYLNQTGTVALERRAEAEGRLEALRSHYRRGLSPAAQREYDRLSQSIADSAREEFIRHDAGQTRTVTNVEGEAAMAGFLDEALLNYNNPSRFNQHLQAALDEQARLAELNGWPAEALAKARRELISSAHAGAILRVADEGAGGAARAEERVNRVAEQLTAEDRQRLDTVLRPMARADRARMRVESWRTEDGSPAEVYQRSSLSPSARAQRAADVDRMLQGRRAAPDAHYNIEYNMQGVRQQPLQADLARHISSAVEQVYGGGYRAVVYSGGQDAEGPSRTGSPRHDHGHAADVHIYGPDGRLSGDDLAPLLQYWLASGIGSVGAEMRGGGVHLDTHAEGARHWDYADRGGSITSGQRAAMEAGLRGEMPLLRGLEGPTDPMQHYFVRNFGEEGARALMNASPGASVESVIGIARARELDLVGTTVGHYRMQLARAYGAPGAPQSGNPRQYDFPSMIRRALEITDPAERAATLEEIETLRRATEAAEGMERRALFDDLFNRGVEGRQWNLSAQDAMALGAELTAAFRAAAENHLRGVQHTDPRTYSSLLDQAHMDPDRFLDQDLGVYLSDNHLDAQAFLSLRQLQREMQEARDNAGAVTASMIDNARVFDAFNKVAPIYQNILGYDPREPQGRQNRREQVDEFRRALRLRLAQYIEQHGEQPGEAALQTMAYELLAPTTAPARLFGETTGQRFDADRGLREGDARLDRTPYREIPAFDRARLEALVRQNAGTDVDTDTLRFRTEVLHNLEQIMRGPLTIRDLSPDVSITDILADPDVAGVVTVRRQLFARPTYEVDLGDGQTATLSEEELRGYYLRTMMEMLEAADERGSR